MVFEDASERVFEGHPRLLFWFRVLVLASIDRFHKLEKVLFRGAFHLLCLPSRRLLAIQSNSLDPPVDLDVFHELPALSTPFHDSFPEEIAVLRAATATPFLLHPLQLLLDLLLAHLLTGLEDFLAQFLLCSKCGKCQKVSCMC